MWPAEEGCTRSERSAPCVTVFKVDGREGSS